MDDRGRALLEYACGKFEQGSYDEALEAFVLAYGKGIEPEWVLENINRCYLSGNEAAFREAYGKGEAGRLVAYEDCLLDFIPYRDGEYFIFDKGEGRFRGTFFVAGMRGAELSPALREHEFSPAALALDWDIRTEADIFAAAYGRKVYLVCHDARRCLSFWKIPELADCAKNIRVFPSYSGLQEYFHENTSEYLPMVIRGSREEGLELARIRSEEHQYRLTPEGRNTENVILTIAIPTANRGNLLLKRLERLLAMPYDAEVEVAVSKNCSRFYEEEYQKAAGIKDARLHYYDHKKDLTGMVNFQYAVRMSCGRYVMLVSDEDDVILENIEHYLKLLAENPELAVVRPRGTGQLEGIAEKIHAHKGMEAFLAAFLHQNYISGLTFRRKDFIGADFMEKLGRFSENAFYIYYPHEWWCAVLSREGDYREEPVFLIEEGKSVAKEEEKKTGTWAVLAYGTYEARIKQLQGQAEFLRWFFGEDKEGIEAGMRRVMEKGSYLLLLARRLGYDHSDYLEALDKYVAACIEGIEGFCLEDGQKIALLDHLKECYLGNFAMDRKLREEGR